MAISAVFILLSVSIPVIVMVIVGKVVSTTIVVRVRATVALGRTGPGGSGSAEGPIVGVVKVLAGAAMARLLAMLDIPMLSRFETL